VRVFATPTRWMKITWLFINKIGSRRNKKGKVGVRGVWMGDHICIWYLVLNPFFIVEFHKFFLRPFLVVIFLFFFGRVKWDTQNAAYRKVKGSSIRESRISKTSFQYGRPKKKPNQSCRRSRTLQQKIKKSN